MSNEELNGELVFLRNVSAGILVLLLLSMYGGITFSYGEGTWFYYEATFESTDSNEYEFEAQNYYSLDGIESEGYVEVEGDKTDLDDNAKWDDVEFKEREEVIIFTKNLVTLNIILAGILLALLLGFLNGSFPKEKSEEYVSYAKNISIGIAVLCLIAAGNFALAYPEAWQDDTDDHLEDVCAVDDGDEIPKVALFLGKCENESTNVLVPPYTGDFNASWHPGPAWFFTAVVPGIAAISYYKLKELEENGLMSTYSKRIRKKGLQVPPMAPIAPQESEAVKPETKKSSSKKAFKPKPKKEIVEIECPGCKSQMSVQKLNKLQDVKCKDCGLSGEIEV